MFEKQRKTTFVILGLMALFFPIFLNHPTWLLGILINAILVFGALKIRGFKLNLLALFPSIGVIIKSIIGSNLSITLIYFSLLVIMGNLILIYILKNGASKDYFSQIFNLIIASMAKTGFLYFTCYIMIEFNFLPKSILANIGLFQLYTALIGGLLTIFLLRFIKNKLS